jgi:DNA-binding NtrC family response regulator
MNNTHGEGERYDDMTTERELLYKILFDMRNDINELKRMMHEALNGGLASTPRTEHNADIAGLLPAPQRQEPSYDYEEMVEVVDDLPMHELTKEDVQREQIIQALRKHGYNRKNAARELFISERTLYRRMKALGIDEGTL